MRPRTAHRGAAGPGLAAAAGARRGLAGAGLRRGVRILPCRRGDGGRCQPCSAADRARGRPRRGPGRRHDGAPLGRVPRRSRGRRPAAGGGRRGDGADPRGRPDAPLVRGRERQRGDARPAAHHRGGRQRHHVDRGHAADGGGPVRQRRGDRPAGAARRLPRRARYRQRPDGADVRGLGEPRGRDPRPRRARGPRRPHVAHRLDDRAASRPQRQPDPVPAPARAGRQLGDGRHDGPALRGARRPSRRRPRPGRIGGRRRPGERRRRDEPDGDRHRQRALHRRALPPRSGGGPQPGEHRRPGTGLRHRQHALRPGVVGAESAHRSRGRQLPGPAAGVARARRRPRRPHRAQALVQPDVARPELGRSERIDAVLAGRAVERRRRDAHPRRGGRGPPPCDLPWHHPADGRGGDPAGPGTSPASAPPVAPPRWGSRGASAGPATSRRTRPTRSSRRWATAWSSAPT